MPNAVRRVVTGHDEQGRSIVVEDGAAPFVHVNPLDPEWYSTDVVRTEGAPARVVARPPETTLGPRRQLPTPRSTVIRINNFSPEPEAVRQMTPDDSRRAFGSLGNPDAATFGKGGRHPLMHRTETIDYAIVLSGEITMLLDVGEVVLNAGDILVQCGTSHAWVNRTSAPAVVAFILIDGEYDTELAEKLPA